MTQDASEQTPSAQRATVLSGAGLIAALVILVAFGVFVWYLVTQRGAQEPSWSRLAWVFSSVEAIAFGAAGALFGSSIQRQRAEKAEDEARKNADAAAKGQALAASIKADDPGRPEGRSTLEALGPGGKPGGAAASLAARHALIAKELFP